MAGPGGHGSFLAEVTRQAGVRDKTLNSLNQLGTTGSKAPVSQPLPRPNGSNSLFDAAVSNWMGTEKEVRQEPAQEPRRFTPPQEEPQAPQVNWTQLSSLNSAVNEDITTDMNFYTKTGRMPSETDKKLIEAKQAFFLNSGRMPTAQELLYEVQRGTSFSRDTFGP